MNKVLAQKIELENLDYVLCNKNQSFANETQIDKF